MIFKKQIKSYLFFLLKVLISALLFYLALSKIDFHSLQIFWHSEKYLILIAVLGLGMLQISLEFLRYYLSIKPELGSTIDKRLLKVFFIGYSLRFILPGSQGEIGKMLFLPGSNRFRITSFFTEKFCFITTTVFVLSFAGSYLFPDKTLYFYSLILIVPILSTLILYMIKHPLSGKITLEEYPYTKLFLINSVISFVHLGIISLQYWLLLCDHGIGFLDNAAAVITVQSIILIPVTFAGLGLREVASIKIFDMFNIPSESSLSAPLLVFALNVAIPAIIGSIIFMSMDSQIKRESFNLNALFKAIKSRLRK